MTGLPDPKGPRRIEDREAVRAARLRFQVCAACGDPAGGIHHIVQKGSPHFGDDVIENLLGLCGHGTMGCHGATHGSAYLAVVYWTGPSPGADYQERRDAEWVNRRIGEHLLAQRPDTIAYVLGKIGEEAGRAWLERTYYLFLP